MDYVLKRILPSGVDAALKKADKYRELNQPAEAESICRDVLALNADHQLALRTLGLALSDQFEPASGVHYGEAKKIFARLHDPYERSFYGGLADERQARTQLRAKLPIRSVRPFFERALAGYAEAEPLRPAGNDDPILRWNSCVRTLQAVETAAGYEAEPHGDVEGDFVSPHR
jgi:hypothetical protein